MLLGVCGTTFADDPSPPPTPPAFFRVETTAEAAYLDVVEIGVADTVVAPSTLLFRLVNVPVL